jgi:predicted phage tail protein
MPEPAIQRHTAVGGAKMNAMRFQNRRLICGVALILLSFFVVVPLPGWQGAVITMVLSIVMFIAGLALIGNRRGGRLKLGILTPAEYVKRCRQARDRGVELDPHMIQRARDIDPTF